MLGHKAERFSWPAKRVIALLPQIYHPLRGL
jgi:hypothetical protein